MQRRRGEEGGGTAELLRGARPVAAPDPRPCHRADSVPHAHGCTAFAPFLFCRPSPPRVPSRGVALVRTARLAAMPRAGRSAIRASACTPDAPLALDRIVCFDRPWPRGPCLAPSRLNAPWCISEVPCALSSDSANEAGGRGSFYSLRRKRKAAPCVDDCAVPAPPMPMPMQRRRARCAASTAAAQGMRMVARGLPRVG